MASEQEKKIQSPDLMMLAASLAGARIAPTASLPLPSGVSPGAAPQGARQGMKVSFFFDGTGNNLDADYATREHSNVARLFRVHPQSDTGQAAVGYYIPGLGTRFKEINDPGSTTTGLAFGGMGEERLEWAMKVLDSRVSQARGQPVNVALFGFSRGAALARAFARRIAERCSKAAGGEWRFESKGGTTPLRLYFMGLFDTVASVGRPWASTTCRCST